MPEPVPREKDARLLHPVYPTRMNYSVYTPASRQAHPGAPGLERQRLARVGRMSQTSAEERDCLFCRIVAGEIPATVVKEGERVLAFRDVNPQAPTHVLVIPRAHHRSVAALAAADPAALADLVTMSADVAPDEGRAAIDSSSTPASRRARRSSTCTVTCWPAGRCPGRPGEHRTPGLGAPAARPDADPETGGVALDGARRRRRTQW